MCRSKKKCGFMEDKCIDNLIVKNVVIVLKILYFMIKQNTCYLCI